MSKGELNNWEYLEKKVIYMHQGTLSRKQKKDSIMSRIGTNTDTERLVVKQAEGGMDKDTTWAVNVFEKELKMMMMGVIDWQWRPHAYTINFITKVSAIKTLKCRIVDVI